MLPSEVLPPEVLVYKTRRIDPLVMDKSFVKLNDLALIGDRRTCALLDKQGKIVWYCPGRFDEPSLFAHLLDPHRGGAWHLTLEGVSFERREYVEDSALLRTYFKGEEGSCFMEDWMPLYGKFFGLCRTFSGGPGAASMLLSPRPNYGRRPPVLNQQSPKHVTIDYDTHLYASHALQLDGQDVRCHAPAGEKAWFILAAKVLNHPWEELQFSRDETLENWRELASHINYYGPYEQEVRHSLRVLRLLTHVQNGGIIAAATTSLPEVISEERNYDYRYVWLRDAAMIVSALSRAGSDGEEERKFLSFICSAMHRIKDPAVPMLTLDGQPAGKEQELQFAGYRHSKPVRYGNGAYHQLQLDANSNVIIAAKVIYNRFDTREHWETIEMLADYLVEHWQEEDHGIWEESVKKQYTSSKVITSISLEYIADHSQKEEQKQRWKEAAREVREFIMQNCITSEGAFAVYAGSEDVDVSAVLFPIWGFIDADAEVMLKTIKQLEKEYRQDNLYRRHLVEYDSSKEGAFLAGTFWVAQYWVMRKEWDKVESILAAALRFMNDVGIMPEEGDVKTGEWLGNLPQTFVHASLIGTIIDYKQARYGQDKEAGNGEESKT